MSALPVIAVSASKRRFGVVCLSPRLTATRAELHCLHRYATRARQIAAIRRVLEEVFQATDAPTLLFEDEVDTRRSLQLAKSSLMGWARENGLQMVRLSRAHACHEICGESDLRIAATRLASRYMRLAREVLDSQGVVRTSAEHWQARQPIIAAFVLAHAFAARSVIHAFGGSIPSHPKPNSYVSGEP